MAPMRNNPGASAGSTLVRTNRAHAPRKCDPFGLIAIEQSDAGRIFECGRQLPGQVDRIPDPGVHSLAADRAMNVGGVTQQKCAPLAKLLRNAMMHAIGGEPIDALDLDLEILNRPALNSLKLQVLMIFRRIVAHRTDEP